jgi:hypothetical protein
MERARAQESAEDEREPGRGIDLFDFLYEIWRAKWSFVAIGLVCVAVGTASSLLTRPATLAPVSTTLFRVPYRLDILSDPAQRSPSQIIGDLMVRALAAAKLDMVHLGSSEPPKDPEDSSFRIFEKISGYSGTIQIEAPRISSDSIENLFLEMAAASKAQATDIAAQMIKDGSTIENIVKQGSSLETEYLARQFFISKRFATLPGVTDGAFRFVHLGAIKKVVVNLPQETASAGWARPVILSLILGVVLGCVFVMFRIAIARRRQLVASFPHDRSTGKPYLA